MSDFIGIIRREAPEEEKRIKQNRGCSEMKIAAAPVHHAV